VAFLWKQGRQPVHLAVVAIYRFDGDRIAEDWGIAAKAEWPLTAPADQ
jgi:hypothetical protein